MRYKDSCSALNGRLQEGLGDGVPGPRTAGGAGGRPAACARRSEAAGSARALDPECEPGRLARAADRRPVGRGAARDGGDERAGVRVAAPEAAAAGDTRDPAPRLPARCRARRDRRLPLRAAPRGRRQGAGRGRPGNRRRLAARSVAAVARPGPRRVRAGAVCEHRGREARRPARGGARGADPGRPGARPARRSDRRAGGADRRASAPRAAHRAADARALPLGETDGGACRLQTPARNARRARPRARRDASRCWSGRSSTTIPRSTRRPGHIRPRLPERSSPRRRTRPRNRSGAGR